MGQADAVVRAVQQQLGKPWHGHVLGAEETKRLVEEHWTAFDIRSRAQHGDNLRPRAM